MECANKVGKGGSDYNNDGDATPVVRRARFPLAPAAIIFSFFTFDGREETPRAMNPEQRQRRRRHLSRSPDRKRKVKNREPSSSRASVGEVRFNA